MTVPGGVAADDGAVGFGRTAGQIAGGVIIKRDCSDRTVAGFQALDFPLDFETHPRLIRPLVFDRLPHLPGRFVGGLPPAVPPAAAAYPSGPRPVSGSVRRMNSSRPGPHGRRCCPNCRGSPPFPPPFRLPGIPPAVPHTMFRSFSYSIPFASVDLSVLRFLNRINEVDRKNIILLNMKYSKNPKYFACLSGGKETGAGGRCAVLSAGARHFPGQRMWR